MPAGRTSAGPVPAGPLATAPPTLPVSTPLTSSVTVDSAARVEVSILPSSKARSAAATRSERVGLDGLKETITSQAPAWPTMSDILPSGLAFEASALAPSPAVVAPACPAAIPGAGDRLASSSRAVSLVESPSLFISGAKMATSVPAKGTPDNPEAGKILPESGKVLLGWATVSANSDIRGEAGLIRLIPSAGKPIRPTPRKEGSPSVSDAPCPARILAPSPSSNSVSIAGRPGCGVAGASAPDLAIPSFSKEGSVPLSTDAPLSISANAGEPGFSFAGNPPRAA